MDGFLVIVQVGNELVAVTPDVLDVIAERIRIGARTESVNQIILEVGSIRHDFAPMVLVVPIGKQLAPFKDRDVQEVAVGSDPKLRATD